MSAMRKAKAVETTEKKRYEKPLIRSEKEAKELSFNCPTTNPRYCPGGQYSPKKGRGCWGQSA